MIFLPSILTELTFYFIFVFFQIFFYLFFISAHSFESVTEKVINRKGKNKSSFCNSLKRNEPAKQDVETLEITWLRLDLFAINSSTTGQPSGSSVLQFIIQRVIDFSSAAPEGRSRYFAMSTLSIKEIISYYNYLPSCTESKLLPMQTKRPS